ncbi:MAG TPA: amino acid-binding protein [Verrucomicrobiae bacterium]|nr:amino acid-binding protein [Verrucomicrobiae bacterium]
MKLKVSHVDVWAATIKDRPGGLAEKLSALSKAKANLEFVIARRAPERRGEGVVFLTPVKGGAQAKAARAAGFMRTEGLQSVRVEGRDKPGLGAKLARKLAAARINLRGFSAAAIGKRFVAYLAFDSAATAKKAARVLKGK